jgi:hypothetical protein
MPRECGRKRRKAKRNKVIKFLGKKCRRRKFLHYRARDASRSEEFSGWFVVARNVRIVRGLGKFRLRSTARRLAEISVESSKLIKIPSYRLLSGVSTVPPLRMLFLWTAIYHLFFPFRLSRPLHTHTRPRLSQLIP